jgi:hypothetical protein
VNVAAAMAPAAAQPAASQETYPHVESPEDIMRARRAANAQQGADELHAPSASLGLEVLSSAAALEYATAAAARGAQDVQAQDDAEEADNAAMDRRTASGSPMVRPPCPAFQLPQNKALARLHERM